MKVLKKKMIVTNIKDIAPTRVEYFRRGKAALVCGFTLCFADWWKNSPNSCLPHWKKFG